MILRALCREREDERLLLVRSIDGSATVPAVHHKLHALPGRADHR